MRLWKIALLVAIVASGFGTGYVWKHRKTLPQPNVAVNGSTTPDYDPNLILPPPDTKGVIVDGPIDDVRNHFNELAGLKTTENGLLPDGTTEIAPIDARNNWPPLDLVPATFQEVVRLPAPDEEQRPSPAIRRTWHRQTATWMYTNRREVRLNFDVTRQCIAGIRAVELWCRRSPGSAYECVDRMEGSKSPFTTHLWSEGNYEFRLVVVDGLGAKTIPSDDDLPDIYVCLDTTLPIIEMQRPVFDSPGVLKLSWLAGDRNLDDNPIRLEFTEDGVTWKPLAERDVWLPNTGQYLWKAPEGLSEKARFRALARDKAGNVVCSSAPRKNESFDYILPEAHINGFMETLPEPRPNGVKLSLAPAFVPEVSDFPRLFFQEEILALPRTIEQLPVPREVETKTLPIPSELK